MTYLIRSTSLAHFAELAREVGIDPKRMLGRAGLPLSCLDRHDQRVPVSGVRRLLTLSAAESGIETFGLRLIERSDFSRLGPLALLLREQATIGAALEKLVHYVHLHNEGIRLAIEHYEDIVTIAQFFRGRAQRQTTEMALGSLHRIIHFLLGGYWQPLEVHLMHGPPGDPEYHRQFFGCFVTFDSDFDGIVCATADMNRPIPSANSSLARYVQNRVEALYDRPESWDGKIAEVVRGLLPSGNCSVETVAAHFGCDRRTIHRHLADCGTSFTEILGTQRSELVARLIEDRSRPLADIAGLLGFSAQSAMARWFRQRFGCSVSEWRASSSAIATGTPDRLAKRRRPQPPAGRP
jgi:AraC-like DNA-binding protein